MPTPREAYLELIRRDSYLSMLFLGGFDYVDLHAKWHHLLNTVPRFALKAPTGHAKTTNFLYHIAWKIGHRYNDPSFVNLLFCCNFRESKFRVQAIGQIVNSDKYKELFPWVIPDKNNFNKEYLRFHSDFNRTYPQVLGLGYDSSWTGIRGSDVNMDDVVDFKTAFQYETQQKFIRTFNTDLKNRMIPGARLHYIYTPITRLDLSAEIENEKLLPIYSYDYRNYEKDKKLLMPEYWTREAVEKKKNEEPLAYKQGFLLIPLTSDERILFDLDQFEFISNLNTENLRPTCSVDLATGRYAETGEKLDRSCLTIGFKLDSFKYIHDIILLDEKVIQYDEDNKIDGGLVKIIDEYDKKYNFAEIVFESNSFQYIFGDLPPNQLGRKFKASPTTKSNKRDINIGLESFAEQIHAKNIKFNKKIEDNIEVMKEFEAYPFGKHDDAVMSSWIWWSNICNIVERWVL